MGLSDAQCFAAVRRLLATTPCTLRVGKERKREREREREKERERELQLQSQSTLDIHRITHLWSTELLNMDEKLERRRALSRPPVHRVIDDDPMLQMPPPMIAPTWMKGPS
jgi:muconolactone delta-isomerase